MTLAPSAGGSPEPEEVLDAELVDDTNLPALTETAPGVPGPRYLVTQHTMLAPDQLPPTADWRPPWTDADFRISTQDAEDLDQPTLADNTVTNRDSTIRAFQQWCAAQDPPRVPHPCTTATYTAYGLHLIRQGKAGQFKPDSVRQYMSRIYNWQPVDYRPDPTQVRARIRKWRNQWAQGGGETKRSAALTIDYTLRCLEQCDETTNIGKRDAFALVLGYANLHRRSELTNLLVKHVKVMAAGIHVTVAASKTDQAGKGSSQFIADRTDLRIVERTRAWLEVLHDLGADGPTQPLFRGLTVKGALRIPTADRGEHMKPGSINDRVQLLADRAGVPYIDGKKVTAHSLRAGANTDMRAAGVPLVERNRRGRWANESHTADTVYDRPHISDQDDPLSNVPLFGRPGNDRESNA